MPLQPQSPASHNRMLGRRIPHPKSTNFNEESSDSTRPAKRPRIHGNAPVTKSPGKGTPSDTPDSEDELDRVRDEDAPRDRRTDLESALPPVRTDEEAIEEYELGKAADMAEEETAQDRMNNRKWVKGRSSIYVDAFNLALDTVLEEESHLFDEPEKAVFQYWKELDYERQYLYVRLFLRKTSAWHRINTLGYHSDIADIDAAIDDLQQTRSLPSSSAEEAPYPGELEPPEGTFLGASFTFADRSEEMINTLEEASSLLKLDELKAIAKDAKVIGKNKKELLDALRRSSRKQTGLGRYGLGRSDTADSDKESSSALKTPDVQDSDESSRDNHFTKKILAETGPCIRLSLPVLKLFERVHLVFYRSSEWTEKSLTTIILAKISRRNFPDYIVSRSANIFASRSLLLEFEASLRTQYLIDSILEFHGQPTREDFERIIEISEQVYPRWVCLLREEQAKEDSIYQSGEGAYLRRLSPAWVYTRIMHKAAYVHGRLKQHNREYELLVELLNQRLFHHSRRGAWHQRKALLEEHYMAALHPSEGRSEENQKKHWKHIALKTCEDGLQDPLVHLIYHYDLQKRVRKLEKALRIAKRFQHDFSHVSLAAPKEVTVHGIRIETDQTVAPPPASRRNSSPHPYLGKRGTKTVWLDPLEGDGECSVEAMCLSHYRSEGWKGYHSEGGILRTLFGYLLFDVMFTYIPNVFQTPFQTCPLDLHTDAFYPSRLSEINHRLMRISNGEAEPIIRQVWTDHHERQTCIVGLDWSFELDDLVEIVQCFPPEALATICRVMAQEYGVRGGGMPDLFLWKIDSKEVKFSEVKSENDRLSDTQRLWIHVLTGSGVCVELCNAVAKEVRVR